jgi:(1->4)-alpha-D-glucan 1-alpha-D-glucosylmutase
MPAPGHSTGAAAALARHPAAVRRPSPALAPLAPTPSATYRIQFGPGFGFSDARRLVPFLYRAGITHIYASPVFESRRGSLHGYDVVDPTRLRAELGAEDEFNALVRDLKRRGMGLILDIVPNHMAACSDNPWWSDVLEDGRDSLYADYFDIDWNAAGGKLVLPFLGNDYDRVLENGELQLHLGQHGLTLRYWDHSFPISASAYDSVLPSGGGVPSSIRMLLAAIRHLPAGGRVRIARKNEIKTELWSVYSAGGDARRWIDAALARMNEDKSELRRLIDAQPYRLAFWRSGRNQVNYRRFFDINDLAGVRVEDPEVLSATHALVFRLMRENKIDGVRIDHIDGLYDPTAYLHALADQLAAAAPNRPAYLLVEKILACDERLNSAWPVHGATGYEFQDKVNSVFVDGRNLPRLEATYARFSGKTSSFEQTVYEQKKRVLPDLFGGELARLGEELHAISAAADARCERSELMDELVETTACLRVYRTYIRDAIVTAADRRVIDAAMQRAALKTDPRLHRALAFLRGVLTVDLPRASLELEKRCLRFVMRWQQLTGPAMAKGMEDTACYRYNALCSLNIVGASWKPVEIAELHQFAARRRDASPHALNATSTHDTKRSEDVRARIGVLSEIPDEWEQWLERWTRWNAGKKEIVRAVAAPCPADEILLYQVLLGAWPLHPNEEAAFRCRITQFIVKAAREAKLHTNWIDPNTDYEAALVGFVDRILAPADRNPFLDDLRQAQSLIAPFGAISSLAQLVLKMTAPGVPDFYQGSLLWDFSLVDPDNRRPVDFEKRVRFLEDLYSRGRTTALADSLRASWRDGRIKMYTAWRALAYRRAHADLFASGDYLPLPVEGAAQRHVIAFARRRDLAWAVVIVPRLLASLDCRQAPFSCPDVWGDTRVVLPEDAPAALRNLYTNECVTGRSIPVRAAFRHFPVALLSGGRS